MEELALEKGELEQVSLPELQCATTRAPSWKWPGSHHTWPLAGPHSEITMAVALQEAFCEGAVR